MRVETETDHLERCSGADSGLPGPFWQTRGSLARGLRAIPVRRGERTLLHVFTGGPGSKAYTPSGTHSPVNVDCDVDITQRRVDKLSATYRFGASRPVDDHVTATVTAEILEFSDHIVCTSPTFTDLWDAATAATAAELDAATADRHRRDVERIAADVGDVLATTLDLDGVRAVDLATNEHVQALAAELAGDPPERNYTLGFIAEQIRTLTHRGVLSEAEFSLDHERRLSEAEMVALSAEAIADSNDALDLDTATAAAAAVYGVYHRVYYTTGMFPDRGVGDTRPDTLHAP
jgi:hypothetical protein